MDMTDMFKVFRKEVDWAGRKLVLETGKIARQADGAVLATYGGTTVLATVVFEKKPKPGLDFFPLTVNYQEKAFAAGKIPGGFFKREGRPSEKEVLTSRLIDRPIRPLFPESFRNETLVDRDRWRTTWRTIPTSSRWSPLGGADALRRALPGPDRRGPRRLPRRQVRASIRRSSRSRRATLDLVVAGTNEGVLMVESEAKELPEDVMLKAVMEGHRSFQPVIEAIIQLAEQPPRIRCRSPSRRKPPRPSPRSSRPGSAASSPRPTPRPRSWRASRRSAR